MKFITTSVFVLLIWGCSTPSYKTESQLDSSHKCKTVTTSRTWRYCLSEFTSQNSQEVLYYFHGGGGNEHSWNENDSYTSEIRNFWRSKRHRQPNVVSVSFGEYWLLTDKNSRDQSGLYEVFIDEVIPYIESRVLGKIPTSRLVLGESMGGYNAARVGVKNPRMFKRVALLCPATDFPLPNSDEELLKYIEQTGAESSYARKAAQIASIFLDTSDSAKSNSPYNLVTKVDNSNLPNLYVSCGDKDQYGFFVGAQKFAQMAERQGAHVTWVPLNGKHCAVDTASVAEFLIH